MNENEISKTARRGEVKDSTQRCKGAKAQREVNENEISKHIITAAIEVHRTLGGPGLLENVYEEALVWELGQKGFAVDRQKMLPIAYKGITLATPLRIDVMINNLVIIECKSTAEYNPIFEAQLLTYLRLTDLKLGLVINFGSKYVKQGIRRVVNGLQE